jgi:hypothetical protein
LFRSRCAEENRFTSPCLGHASSTSYTFASARPPIWSNPMAEMKELHRPGTVEEYQRQFQSVMTCPPSSGPISSFAAGMGRPLQTVVVELRALANLRGAEHGGGIRPGGQSLPRAQEQSAPPQNDGASPRLRRPWPLVSPLRSLPAPKPQQMHDMGSG